MVRFQCNGNDIGVCLCMWCIIYMNIIEKMLCVPCILYFEIFKCTKNWFVQLFTIWFVYTYLWVINLIYYIQQCLGFSFTVIQAGLICNQLCIRYIHFSEKYVIFFVYTPSWVILVSQNLTCSNVYDMFSVYSLMNCNFDIVHSSGAFHCNSNQG